MKKSLLAVAAMTAFAGAAQAQSSVSVYGILDVGYVGSSYQGTAATQSTYGAGLVAPGSGVQKQTTNAFGQSAESSSRLGFKGSEDLGGGRSAIFTLEIGVNPNGNETTGGAIASTTGGGTGSGTFLAYNRQTFVGLKDNALGTAMIGTQYTPIFDVQSITDAAGNNNMVGNAIYSGSLQSGTGTFNIGQGPNAGLSTSGLNAETGAFVTRASNTLKFVTNRMAGLQGTFSYALASNNQTQTAANFSAANTGGANNNTLMGVALDYTWNKLQVVAAYQQIKSFNPAGGIAANPSVAAGTVGATQPTLTVANGTALNFGLNALDNQSYAAATYDFGIAKAYLQYINRNFSSQQDSTFNAKRSATQIGVRSSLTPNISAFATFGMGNASLYGQSIPTSAFRTFQVGSDYYLSKRTNLYAILGGFNQSSSGASVVARTDPNQSAINLSNYALSGTNYAVGIRHTF
jgi:predicted porin